MLTHFFSSGTNHAGEVRGLACVPGAGIGTVAGELTRSPQLALEVRAFPGDVFIDSGAFSEVSGEGEPLWREVFAAYHEALSARAWTYERTPDGRLESRDTFVVAPDCVGDQAETLRRLRRWAADVEDLWASGALVLVPVQRGEMSLADMWRAEQEALGLNEDGDPSYPRIPALPMKRAATTLDELRAFVREVRPGRLHLLGCAPDSATGQAALAIVAEEAPGWCEVSADACIARRLVGRTNGRGGGPRELTRIGDEVREAIAESTSPGELSPREEVHVRKALATHRAVGAVLRRMPRPAPAPPAPQQGELF